MNLEFVTYSSSSSESSYLTACITCYLIRLIFTTEVTLHVAYFYQKTEEMEIVDEIVADQVKKTLWTSVFIIYI